MSTFVTNSTDHKLLNQHKCDTLRPYMV